MGTAKNEERLLDLAEAAYALRITPELLTSYVRNAPKKALGHNRRLVSIESNGQTLFRRNDLEAFDTYLKEPWSATAHPRPPIPAYILQYLGVECGGKCARCGEGFKLETAHIEPYATSLSHHHHNLIRLCAQCHSEFDDTHIIPPDEIHALKENLIAQLQQRSAKAPQTWPATGSFVPTPSPIFIGRDSEVGGLVEALLQNRVLCIQGPGGIGKTQLALNALNQFQKSAATKIVWLELESFKTIADLELGLWSALTSNGIRPGSALTEVIDAAVGLLVFDGVEALSPNLLEELEDFFSQLISRTRSTKFLFTSQVELLGVEVDFSINLDPLSEGASSELLLALISSHPNESNDDPTATRRLLDFSDGHPLTIKIIGGLLRHFKSARIVAERLEKYGAVTLINPTRQQQKQTKATSLDVCLAVAYDALAQEERKILYVVSHCPAGCLAMMFERPDGYELKDSQAAIAGLSRWNLVYFDRAWAPVQRLQALSPIRAFVQHRYEEGDAEQAEGLFLELAEDLTVQAMVLESAYTQKGDVGKGVFRFSQEFQNFNHMLDESAKRSKTNPEYLKHVSGIAAALQVYCFLTGLSRRGIEIMRVGADAAVQANNPVLASHLLMQLICLAMHGQHYDQARQALPDIIQLANGSTDLDLLGNAALARGIWAKHEDRTKDAEQYLVAANAYFEQPRPTRTNSPSVEGVPGSNGDERMLAMSLMELASLYEHTARPAKALDLYKKSLSLMLKTTDNVNYGSVLHQMGNCYADLGLHEKAYDSYTEASVRFYDIQAAIHIGNSLSELGYLMLDYVPSVPVERLLSPDLLEQGLIDVLDECARVFHPAVNPLPFRECLRLTRKLVGIAIVVNLTRYNVLLGTLAHQLVERLVRPLLNQMAEGKRLKNNDGVPLMYLDVTSALIGSIAYSHQLAVDGEVVTVAEVKHLSNLCYIQHDHAWRIFRLFDWLAMHLRFNLGVQGVTASMLQKAIKDHIETGAPFSLPNAT